MDETRALLDALMGPNRNSKSDKSGEPEFLDKTVCRNFLVGFCPHDWFSMPKRQLKACGKIHSEMIREKFLVHPDAAMYRAEWEEEFLHYLESVSTECDQFIVRERVKCRAKGTGGKVVRLPPDVQTKVDELETRYAEFIAKSQELADKSLSKSEEQMKQGIIVKEEIDSLKQRYLQEFMGEDICEVCGVKYPLGGSPLEWHDKESHMKGKTHQGFAEIREKIKELRGKKKEWEKEKDKKKKTEKESRGKDRDRDRDRDRGDRDRDRDRDKERERDREKEREKDREREKRRDEEREREREKDKEKERMRERFRQAEKEKEVTRQKEKELEEERGKERERQKALGNDKSKSRSRSNSSRSRKGRSPSGEKAKTKDSDKKASQGKDKKPDADKDKGKAKVEQKTKERSRSPHRKAASTSSSSDEEENENDVDIPALWARINKLSAEGRENVVKTLSDKTNDRLEEWLMSRVRKKA